VGNEVSDRSPPSPFEARGEGATPLTHEEKAQLIPAWITNRDELNAAEQENIATATVWAYQGLARHDLLREEFLLNLHRRMLGNVWKWAGQFRTTERNLGANSTEIPVLIRILLDAAGTWKKENSYPPDELAVRFHHRLVSIHPFANGNGRHSRLMADLIVTQLGAERFSWGAQRNLQADGVARNAYLNALKKADGHDISDLIAFARS
jgi:Fic-DOC domain mobile mystery protein B